jgi:pimeloyl-ACP methyl ester carboxylesterase
VGIDLDERYSRRLTLPDGRAMSYADAGDPDGRPIIFCHGTPSSRFDTVGIDRAAAVHGWRLIAIDRPGHGESSLRPGRRLTDWPGDVTAVADALGIDQFVVMGFSGGAPYALVTAQALGERVELVALVSAWGPPDRPGAYDGVRVSERMSDAVARRAPTATRAMFGGISLFLRVAPRAGARAIDRQMASDGRVVTTDMSDGRVIATREAFRQGTAGAAHDLHLIVSTWDFGLDEITAPVRAWHGGRDPEIPLHHSEYIASAVPDGEVEVIAAGDHLMLFAEADAIFAGMADALRSS